MHFVILSRELVDEGYQGLGYLDQQDFSLWSRTNILKTGKSNCYRATVDGPIHQIERLPPS